MNLRDFVAGDTSAIVFVMIVIAFVAVVLPLQRKHARNALQNLMTEDN